MKAKIIILVFILNVSQAYAWGSREQGALLGFVGGVVATAIYQGREGGNATYAPPAYRSTPSRTIVRETRYYEPHFAQVVEVKRDRYYADYRENRHYGERRHRAHRSHNGRDRDIGY